MADECPLSRFADRLPDFLETRPRSWFFCSRAARPGPRPKRSPGVVALEPGATMHATVDTRMHLHLHAGDDGGHGHGQGHGDGASAGGGGVSAWGGGGEANASAAVLLALEHLTSYEGMGIVELRCLDGCACPAQRIDAHRPVASHGRVSVYAVHRFPVAALGGAGCELQLQLLNATSSRGHKFKVT